MKMNLILRDIDSHIVDKIDNFLPASYPITSASGLASANPKS